MLLNAYTFRTMGKEHSDSERTVVTALRNGVTRPVRDHDLYLPGAAVPYT